MVMTAAVSTGPMMPEIHDDVDKLTNKIFSILENKFLFGYNDDDGGSKKAIPQPAAGKVRILSIDAGDGILAAKTLLNFQTILRRKSGNPSAHIADFFDVVTGAGAGGVLAGLLFTRATSTSTAPIFTADQSLKFMLDNHRKLAHSRRGLFKTRRTSSEKLLHKVFEELTLRDTMKAVLIPCYDIKSGAPFLFSRADAVEMDGCDFKMAGVCGATIADRAMELKSSDGRKKIMAVGGGVAMSNPTAAAITHVLNNKQEFPLCSGVQDLLVVSIGNVGDYSSSHSLLQIAADGAADMVDQAVSMAFGEWRSSNYVRIQGNGNGNGIGEEETTADKVLGEKNVESILFRGKKLVEFTNMEKVEMFAGELIKEQHRRNNNLLLPTVILKNSNTCSPSRSSSDTTLSTLSSY